MAEEPENLVLQLLREIRDKQDATEREIREEVRTIREEMLTMREEMRTRFEEQGREIAAIRADVAAIKAVQETQGKIQAMHTEALERTVGLLYLMRGKAA